MSQSQALMLLALILITKSNIARSEVDDDEVLVENIGDQDNSEDETPERDPVPYVSPDIHHSVYFADHFDSDEAFETKWIKSSAKKDGVDSSINQ